MAVVSSTFRVKQSPESIVAWLRENLSTAGNVTGVDAMSPTSVTVRSQGYTTGQVTCMVLLFPIGLLLLLNKQQWGMLVKAETVGDGSTQVTLSGHAHQLVVRKAGELYTSLQSSDSLAA